MIDREAFIRAREAANFSQDQLAKRAGCSQQLVGNIESGTTTTSKFLLKFAKALGVDPGTLDSDYSGVALPPDAEPPAAKADASRLVYGDRDFPVYASAQGGPGEIIRSHDPVDWVPRPEPVARVQKAYGLYVVGESMVPEFEQGEIALVNPILPPVGGTTCIFYSEQEGEARATIKRLIKISGDKWHVRQHNPPAGMKNDFTLSRSEWAVCHRVIGKYYRQ